jgi:hypothetical protein
LNASGTFNDSPGTQNFLPVSWYLLGPGLPTPPASYSLGNQAFLLPCGGNTAIAVAPVNAGAPGNGTIPTQVFQDLVIAHSMSKEDGFIAASMPGQLTC